MTDNIRNYTRETIAILRCKTIRDTGYVFAGNLAGQAIGFLATLVVIRTLSPAHFGLLSTAIAVMGIASQFSDLGISTGFVRYASIYLESDERKAEILFKMTLYLKLIIGLAVLAIGLSISEPLAVHLFKAPELRPLLQLAFIGSLGSTLWGYLQAILQAKKWFVKYAWITVFNNVIRLAGICILVVFERISAANSMLILALVPFAGFFVDGLLVPKKFIRTRGTTEENKQIFSELFNFSKWITASTLCTMFLMRIDVLMLQTFSLPEAVGIYSSANQLAMIFPLITGALTVSLLPKVSSYQSREQIKVYIRKVLKVIPFIVLLFIPLLFLAHYFIPVIFGAKYVKSVPIFQVLILAFVMSIILNPISLIFYSINKAQILTVMNVIQFFIALPLNYLLIARYGALGASWTSFAIRLFALIFVSVLLYQYLKGNDANVAEIYADGST